MSNTKNRGCYCGVSSREDLAREGIPDGYCGICDRCGKPVIPNIFPALYHTMELGAIGV